jgi:hypothetical protein
MAFSNTVLEKKELPGGLMLERGTFSLASVTTGTITLNSATGNPDVQDILLWFFASDGDNAVLPAKDVQFNQMKITGTSDDTGHYVLIGRCA